MGSLCDCAVSGWYSDTGDNDPSTPCSPCNVRRWRCAPINEETHITVDGVYFEERVGIEPLGTRRRDRCRGSCGNREFRIFDPPGLSTRCYRCVHYSWNSLRYIVTRMASCTEVLLWQGGESGLAEHTSDLPGATTRHGGCNSHERDRDSEYPESVSGSGDTVKWHMTGGL